MNAATLRQQIEAAKTIARRNFRQAWGTDSVSAVIGALRETIPSSKSPADAARKAREILA